MITLQVGNIVLATGYELFDPRRMPQYGYGRHANVFTSLEFEQLTNAAGPTDGKVVLRDGETVPKTVAIMHCVGSRDKSYNDILFSDLLHVIVEICPSGQRKDRSRSLQFLY